MFKRITLLSDLSLDEECYFEYARLSIFQLIKKQIQTCIVKQDVESIC